MITPKELLAKIEKSFFRIVSAHLKGEDPFPWIIPSNKQVTGSNYSDWKTDLIPLHQNSKAVKSKGYTIDWKAKIINGSRQSVPSKIYFESFDDFLFFSGRKVDFQKIVQNRDLISSVFPQLHHWSNDNPNILLNNAVIWEDVLKVCSYFMVNLPPHPYYIRELPVQVHTKFIEDNSKLIKILLDLLLPDYKMNYASNDFSGRYYLRKISIYTQIKILDDELRPHLGYDEISLTLEDAAWLTWLPENVFIIENQACFLSFPKFKNSVALFGEGFKSRLSKHIPWLNKTKLFCWFDLDAAGFEILNMIREHYINATSFLMDENTYNVHSQFSVGNKSRKKTLPFLLPSEQKLYDFLINRSKRLEQERIPQQYVLNRLNEINSQL